MTMKILCEEEVKWKDERIHERERKFTFNITSLIAPPK